MSNIKLQTLEVCMISFFPAAAPFHYWKIYQPIKGQAVYI